MLLEPTADGVTVVWFTRGRGSGHEVRLGATRVAATSTRLSQVGEDAESPIPIPQRPGPGSGVRPREIWRHVARVSGLVPGDRVPYRTVSRDGARTAISDVFHLRPAPEPGRPVRILLTSDHQASANTPAAMFFAARVLGRIDAVFFAGDMVNVPDRASEWFDAEHGRSFFPVMQGRAHGLATNGSRYPGAAILQNAPLFTAVGNHEVQGRRCGVRSLRASFAAALPRAVAETEYVRVAAVVNPGADPAVREAWLHDASFSTTTYREIASPPREASADGLYYAATFGDVRLVSLCATRIWRGRDAQPDPGSREYASRYQESRSTLAHPLAQGHGEHIVEPIHAGSAQFAWLESELASAAFRDARFRVVMLHEGPHGLGNNIAPPFTDPVRIEERAEDGALLGVRHEYPAAANHLLRDVAPLLERAGVDLVLSGHSHLWNRFAAVGGSTHYLETSNTGDTHGAFHALSGRTRHVPPSPWRQEDYPSIGDPGGREPVMPTEAPLVDGSGARLPYIASSEHAVFSVLDTGAGEVRSYYADLRVPMPAPTLFDRFSLGRARRE